MTAVELTIEPRRRPVGGGTVDRLLPFRERRMIGPFIYADVIGPETLASGEGMDVDAHPHIGLSTVTYLFDGRLDHRDSTGVVQTIEPGAVNWMTAGSGVTHTERTPTRDRPSAHGVHGMQTWVALPDDAEDSAPSFEHAAAAELPRERSGSSTVTLIVGTGFGLASPVAGSSPMVLARIDLEPGSPVTLDTGHPEIGVVAVDDDVHIGGSRLARKNLAVVDTSSRPRVEGTGRVMVLGGAPVGRRHIWWNFVHGDPDRIEDAKQRWSGQRFPTVPDDHDPWVPLPD